MTLYEQAQVRIACLPSGGVDPMENRTERGFPQRPHLSLRS
jgi:hypothetical protein